MVSLLVWQLSGAEAGHDGAAARAKLRREPKIIRDEYNDIIVDGGAMSLIGVS